MNEELKKYDAICKIEEYFEWRKWAHKIPSLSFPSNWKIQMNPPFGGAVIRFRVSLDNKKNDVSVYLDCYDIIGMFGSPYWEVYPYKEDTYRCNMMNTEELLEAIQIGLDELEDK